MASKTFGTQTARKPHLTRGKGGVAGEVDDLRADVEAAFTKMEGEGGLLRTVEWVDPAAADADYFMTTRASQVAVDTINEDTAEWTGAAELDPPRNLVITSTLHADILGGNYVATGFVRDEDGVLVAQTETIAQTIGGGADAGTRAWSVLTQVVFPAAAGTNSNITIGFGDIIGLPAPMASRAGLLQPIREIEAGSVVTTGTFTTAAAQPPHGTYLAATVPDAANDYALTYEVEV
jgi:hypothetical protein